jgi:mannose-6-phosphate isomerase
VRYDTDAAEFLLRRLDGAVRAVTVAVPDGGPRILLCTAGSASVRTAGDERPLGRGQALWLPADDRGVAVAPQEPGTQLFLASDGLDI